MTDWVYPDSFSTLTEAASWMSIGSLVCCVFLLLSWAVLPVEKTSRHYLSICLTVAVFLMNVSVPVFKLPIVNELELSLPQLGFIIPLAAKPDQCYNTITPNDMHSSKVCGVSGAFLLMDGLL